MIPAGLVVPGFGGTESKGAEKQMTLRKSGAVSRGLTGAGLLSLVAGLAFSIGWLKIVGVVVAAIGLILAWTKMRCPHCGGRIQDLKAECCAACGEPIDYDA